MESAVTGAVDWWG